jgi:hypothetical protein
MSACDTLATEEITMKPFALACVRSSLAIPYGSLVKSDTIRYLQALISPAIATLANSESIKGKDYGRARACNTGSARFIIHRFIPKLLRCKAFYLDLSGFGAKVGIMVKSIISKYMSEIGRRGGKARLRTMTPEERRAIATKASKAAVESRKRIKEPPTKPGQSTAKSAHRSK